LKQIGGAMLVFAGNNNGWLPLSDAVNWNGLQYNSSPYTGSGTNLLLTANIELAGVAREMHDSGLLKELNIWICASDKGEGSDNRQAVGVATNIANFDGFGNASYMYVAGLNDKIWISRMAGAVMLADEAAGRETQSSSLGALPALENIDNHGKNSRNVLFFDGHVSALRDAEVLSSSLFPSGTNAWTDYRRLKAAD